MILFMNEVNENETSSLQLATRTISHTPSSSYWLRWYACIVEKQHEKKKIRNIKRQLELSAPKEYIYIL